MTIKYKQFTDRIYKKFLEEYKPTWAIFEKNLRQVVESLGKFLETL